jgi:hypothetical protein
MSPQLRSRGPVRALTLIVPFSRAWALRAKQWRPSAAKNTGNTLGRYYGIYGAGTIEKDESDVKPATLKSSFYRGTVYFLHMGSSRK